MALPWVMPFRVHQSELLHRSWRTRAAACTCAALLVACGDTGPGGAPGPGPGPGPGEDLCELDGQTFTGEGTYYDADGSGNCSFPASPGDLLVAAMNDLDYDGSAVCGACAAIDGPDGSVTVRIVDRCPECARGDIDMSPQAFERIAPIAAGRVPISWRYVACEPAGAIVYHFKEGSNQWWTAVQIRNHRHPIDTLEFQAGDGSFRAVPRESYNYFVEETGMGPGPYTFRVTDVLGNVVEDTGVPLVENGESTGARQFPACASAQGTSP
jgi:expansin (peptidoglycan-binding protein)